MFCMKLVNRSKLACICLQKKIKQLVLSTKRASNASEIKVATRKHNNLDRIVVSVNNIDNYLKIKCLSFPNLSVCVLLTPKRDF